ncbi:tetratricopeptide repeat protein [Winogradskyella jejuensis]|nr:hypothetical protein [Winogradskyella jejuensis]
MKTKITLLLIALVVGFNTSYSQQDEECMNNLSIFDSYAKNKKYDEAYEPWMKVRTKCPQFNRAIYVRGEKILEHKIDKSSGAEKVDFIRDLLKVYEEYNQYYASKFPLGKMQYEKGKLSYKYKKELGLSDEQLYNVFDKGYTDDLNNFNDPKGLYIYFKMMVKLYDSGKKTPQELFDKYDDVNDKIEEEVGKLSEKVNKLIQKEESGATLTKKEASRKSSYESYLNAYDQISGSVDTEIGNRATCEVLIPLYQKDFDEKKNDTKWLQRAMNKMYAKECTDDPMFIKVVQQKNTIEPNADTAYYLGVLKEKEGKTAEAEKYYKQSMDLQTDSLKKWKLVYRLAEKNRKKGSYGKARQLYNECLKLNPSNGNPHLRIAGMYASSANNCGDSTFNKRAVYWLAAAEARKAGRVDGRLKKAAAQSAASYEAKAPDKSMIFSASNSGSTIKIGCWIGRSVTVP